MRFLYQQVTVKWDLTVPCLPFFWGGRGSPQGAHRVLGTFASLFTFACSFVSFSFGIPSFRLISSNVFLVLFWFSSFHWVNCFINFWASFSPPAHLAVQDIAVDSPSVRNCDYVTIMALKTHLFCKGCLIHYWPGWVPLRAVHTLLA